MIKELCCIDCDHIFKAEADDALTCENCGSDNIEELPDDHDEVEVDGHYEGDF